MKAYKIILVMSLIIFSCIFIPSNAQSKQPVKNNLTGNLQFDSNLAAQNIILQSQPDVKLQNPKKKSRFLAGLFSAILPGSGEFYSEHYLKAAIFFAIEAAGMATAIIYHNKGNNQTDFFQSYADANWYVSKYAYWALKHSKEINPNIDPNNYHIFRTVDVNSIDPNTADWKKLDGHIDWNQLNDYESALGNSPDAGGFTHRLPRPGEQQYYELIGKYYQYTMGWNETNISNTQYSEIPQQMTYYAHQRGLANTYYNTGETAVIFLYVNHILSVFDAIWSTDRYNETLAMNMRVQGINYAGRIEMVPTLNMSYNF